MNTIKVSELTGAALDFAVAKCEWYREEGDWRGTYNARYSTEWAQGGPIIERLKISLVIQASMGQHWTATFPAASPVGYKTIEEGPTPLIAAMRCYVASKLGDTVDIPKELNQ